jgi:Bifunctional DNA primase/polymerase, N-terminal
MTARALTTCQRTDRRELVIPDVAGLDVASAALLYAEAGWFVLPTHAKTKHAGSVLGQGWPRKSSREPDQVKAWFLGTDYGLALHVGRSGSLGFDVDHPDNLPTLLAEGLAQSCPPFQSTRADELGRGHFLFAQPVGADLGNGKGRLQGAWGDVRGRNGIILVEPTPHQKGKSGGRYVWQRRGALPILPAILLKALQVPRRAPASRPGDSRTALVRNGSASSRRHLRTLSLEQIVQRILDAGQRNNAVFEGACRVGELIARGRMSREVGTQVLLRAGRAVGLDDIELLGVDGRSGTINSGMATGEAAVKGRSPW